MDENETVADTATATSDLDTAAAAAIAEISQEWEAKGLADLPDGEEPPPSAEAAAPPPAEGEAPQEDKAEVEVVAEEAPAPEDRGLERLVAREVEIRAKEEALRTREAQFSAVESENAALKSRVSELESRSMELEDLRTRPFDALEAAGHDPDHVVRLILAKKFEKDGKQVPPELRQAIREAEFEHKQRQLDQKLANYQYQQAAAAFAAKVESDARQYVTTQQEAYSKYAPLVAAAAKTNPDRVHQEILDEVSRDARDRAGKDPNAALLTFDEAAKRVEKRWAEFRALFGDPAASMTAPGTIGTQGAQTGTSVAKQPRAAAPPAKPLVKTPAKSLDDLEREAIEQGMAEYKRVETAKRAVTRS